MLPRPHYAQAIRSALERSPVVALLGPRQCGKTTLARAIAGAATSTWFDLEDPVDQARLAAPRLALAPLEGLVIIDEVQRMPALFELLRVLVDRPANRARFLILGSASPRLIAGASETLAGRVAFVDLAGFDMRELGRDHLLRLWSRGGFPLSYLADDDAASLAWRGDFARTFLERDIPQLGIHIPAATLRRFWTMLAHYHGQVWNGAELARSLGSAEATARRYLDILSGAYMVRQLPPWFANIKKRQVKSPKIYLRDSGVLHSLLSIGDLDALRSHPKLGASWEGFVIEQITAAKGSRDAYFWATHAGAELDLLIFEDGKPYGFEIKYSAAPRTTRSMRSAQQDLALQHLWVVHAGERSYPLDTSITALSMRDLPALLSGPLQRGFGS
jgi:uncharacterized protein